MQPINYAGQFRNKKSLGLWNRGLSSVICMIKRPGSFFKGLAGILTDDIGLEP